MELGLSFVEVSFCVVALLLVYGLRGTTGFSGSLGLPLLAVVIPMKTIVPVWTLLGIASSVTILGNDRKHVAIKAILPFLPWCFLGIGMGLFVFNTINPATLTRAFGLAIWGYAGYSLWQMKTSKSSGPAHPGPFGALASTLSGAVGTAFGALASVFFVMYLDRYKLEKQAFRATLSAMLLTLSMVRGVGYYSTGEFTGDSMVLFAAAFPAMLLGLYLGDRIQLRINEATFKKIVIAALFLCGIPLVVA